MSDAEPPLRLENAEDLGAEPLAIAAMVLVFGALFVVSLVKREWHWALFSIAVLAFMLRAAVSAGRSPGQTGSLDATGGVIRFAFGDWARVVTRVRGAHILLDSQQRAILSFDRGIWPKANFRIGSRHDAYAFVRKLGLARPDTFRSEAGPHGGGAILRSIVHATAYFFVFFGVNLGMRDGRFFLALLPVALVFPLATKVEVGDDGIALRFLGRRTFVPASSIVSLRRVREGSKSAVLRIERRDGPAITLAIGFWPLLRGTLGDWMGERVHTLEARLRDLIGERPPAPETIRAFESASAPDVKALRLLAGRLPTFRETPLTGEELLRIVASDEAPPHLRARAAVVVSAMENVAAKETLLRVAAST
ncbi:MAG: hypothetical protein ACXWUG_30215, partial [Polyangiales bacterium]